MVEAEAELALREELLRRLAQNFLPGFSPVFRPLPVRFVSGGGGTSSAAFTASSNGSGPHVSPQRGNLSGALAEVVDNNKADTLVLLSGAHVYRT